MSNKLKFCPRCYNILYYDEKRVPVRFLCNTCPIQYEVRKRVEHKYKYELQDDEVMIVDQEKSNEHRQKTEVICPECSNNEAYFYQMQTRSADEPMTNFYQCTKTECKHNWRE